MDPDIIMKLLDAKSWDDLKAMAYTLIDDAKAKHKRIPYNEIGEAIVQKTKTESDSYKNIAVAFLNIK